MNYQYFDRYQLFSDEEGDLIVPGIELPIKPSDKYQVYKKNKERLDKISQEMYGTPYFGWLILIANPTAGGLEFEIPDNYLLRIPFPLIPSLQDYKRGVELYRMYYGKR